MKNMSMRDKIQNYIDNVFTGIEDTQQTRRLKQEIADNMEDKLTELLSRGKTPDEALGIVFSEFGSMEELCREMGISAKSQTSERSEQPENGSIENQLLQEYLAFKKNFAVAITLGVLFCIFGLISAAVLDQWNETAAAASFFGLCGIGAALCVYFGIRSQSYNSVKKWMKESGHPISEDEAEERKFEFPEEKEQKWQWKKTADSISGMIMMAATAVFLVCGFVFQAWHPAWIVFPLGGILCGIVEEWCKYRQNR